MMNIDDLLTEIQKAAGCPYLSDLQFNNLSFNEKAKANIMEISEDIYTLAMWNEAVSYILRKPHCFSSIEEAKKAILE